MRTEQSPPRALDAPIDTRLQLGALWTSTMFCYIYCDYFGLYVPGKLDGMLRGEMGPLGAVSQGTLMTASLLMIVPSLMIALSVVLPSRSSRILNIVTGSVYALLLALIAATVSWQFYRLFAVLEAALAATIVVRAWRWRVQPAQAPEHSTRARA